jgi:hypothetical protein
MRTWNDGYEAGFNAGRLRGRAAVVEEVWAFIRDHGTPVTGKGETTLSVDALFQQIDPRRES